MSDASPVVVAREDSTILGFHAVPLVSRKWVRFGTRCGNIPGLLGILKE